VRLRGGCAEKDVLLCVWEECGHALDGCGGGVRDRRGGKEKRYVCIRETYIMSVCMSVRMYLCSVDNGATEEGKEEARLAWILAGIAAGMVGYQNQRRPHGGARVHRESAARTRVWRISAADTAGGARAATNQFSF
jgi:hypothetical protein